MRKVTYEEAEEYIKKEKGLMFENHVKRLYGNTRSKIMYVLLTNDSSPTMYSEEEHIYGPKQLAVQSGRRRTISSIYRLVNHSSTRTVPLKSIYTVLHKLIEAGLITTFICGDIKKRVYMCTIVGGSSRILDFYIGDPHRMDEFGFYVPSKLVEQHREKSQYNLGRYEGNMHAVQLIKPTETYKPTAKLLERKGHRMNWGRTIMNNYHYSAYRRHSRRT